jgi:hypothetical protein
MANQIAGTSVVRERIHHLFGDIEETINRAKAAVQVVSDGNGELVPIGDDLKVLAPLFAQANKNIELLAKVTGEIVRAEHRPAQLTVNIVMPAAMGTRHVERQDIAEDVVIDVSSAAKIGSR